MHLRISDLWQSPLVNFKGPGQPDAGWGRGRGGTTVVGGRAWNRNIACTVDSVLIAAGDFIVLTNDHL